MRQLISSFIAGEKKKEKKREKYLGFPSPIWLRSNLIIVTIINIVVGVIKITILRWLLRKRKTVSLQAPSNSTACKTATFVPLHLFVHQLPPSKVPALTDHKKKKGNTGVVCWLRLLFWIADFSSMCSLSSVSFAGYSEESALMHSVTWPVTKHDLK